MSRLKRWNFQGIVFLWTQTYREIFKSALVCLYFTNISSFSFFPLLLWISAENRKKLKKLFNFNRRLESEPNTTNTQIELITLLSATSIMQLRSDSNGTWTHNHLVRKRTLKYLAKLVWLNGWVFVYELNGCGFKYRCCHLNFRCYACLWARSSLTFRQLYSLDSLWNTYVT